MNNSTLLDSFSSSSSMKDWAILLLINQIVYRGYFLFLILAGTCGNFLTAITLLQPKLRKYSTCQFLAVCALFNIGVLLTNTLNMMLTEGYAIYLFSQFDVGWCRINVFAAHWTRGMASWILVIVAFDRFRQSKTVQYTAARKKPFVLLTILATGFALILANLHYLLFTGNKLYFADGSSFLACIFYKQSQSTVQRFFESTSIWLELVTVIIVPSILTIILNIFIIKNYFFNPINNEILKIRSQIRTYRMTKMLFASNIGFLALVAPDRIIHALWFNADWGTVSQDRFRSIIIQHNIVQCLINTYYAASFYKPKPSFNHGRTSGAYSSNEKRPFVQQSQHSGVNCSSSSRINDYLLERTNHKRATESIIEEEAFIEQ